jgi:uncharacterized protein
MVRQRFEAEGTGHDWWHIARVRDMAVRIAHEENADVVVVELAALLHDIADYKFHNGDDSIGPQMAREWLTSKGVSTAVVDHVAEIVASVSFKGAGVPDQAATLEAKIVQDADRLDALGAVGIARAFAYGGSNHRPLYNPAQPPQRHADFESYKSNQSPTINHFYEKLLLLKERLHTGTARRMAEDRHAFMEAFLRQFYAEWKGEK